MVVDQEIFDSNLKRMADHCNKSGIHLRGHVKVHKSPEIAKRQIALGGIGVTCATVAECELMADAGIRGILLTRQPASKNNIGRVIALAKRDPTFGTLVDDPIAADWLHRPPPPNTSSSERWSMSSPVSPGMGLNLGNPRWTLPKKWTPRRT